jgi:immunity protein 26 of polymorphic toxin system
MGWWEADDLALGDEPLDELHRSLREVAASYVEALERPPTVAELERLLALVLGSLTPDQVSGLEEKDVTAVAVKSKKGPRKHTFAVGDTAAIPLPDGTWGFGRVISRRAGTTEAVVEVFRRRSPAPLAGPDVTETGRLMPVMVVPGLNCFENGRWPVLAKDPEFRAPDHDQVRFKLWNGGRRYSVHDIELRSLAQEVDEDDVPPNAIDMEEFTDSSWHDTRRHEAAILAELEEHGL